MLPATPTLSRGRPARLRWTGEEFDRASESGAFDGHRVELIEGDILEMLPMNDPHAYAVQIGNYTLIKLFPPTRFTVRVQLPLRLGDSRPLPDFAIIAGPPLSNQQHPTSALLVIEVSDTTLEFDQVEKARLYASHGIPEYWIADLNARRIEVRRSPVKGADARYTEIFVVAQGETVSPLASPELSLKVQDLIG